MQEDKISAAERSRYALAALTFETYFIKLGLQGQVLIGDDKRVKPILGS